MRTDPSRTDLGLDRFDRNSKMPTISYFIFAVFGFSFWFLMAVPFASHRESYWWLAMVQSHPFSQAFGVISSTYRPLSQPATWLAFLILDPRIFPTSVLRQALLQVFIYVMFVLAWWLVYSAAPQRRLFALVAFVAGGVFFSGYIHLFHIYGIMYVPVMLTLGALLSFRASGKFEKRQMWLAAVATMLAFWHPFATALFVGFYFGFYLDTFWQRSRTQHIQAVVILLAGMMAVAAMVVLFPRTAIPLDTKLLGFLVSYQTNEVNRIASLVAFLLAQMVVFGMGLSPRAKLTAVVFLAALSVLFLLKGLPILLLWICVALIKLARMRCWSLFFLMLTAALLPFGGGVGGPIHALFATIIAVYATPLGWPQAEGAVSFMEPRYVLGTVIALTIVLLMVRAGIEVPIVSRVATPLLAERERTYQLENILIRLRNSEYCGYEITFAENAGSPVDSVESAINRRNRPPAALEDVRLFWNTIFRCREANVTKIRTVSVTFGGQSLTGLNPVFKVAGKYGGDATVWISDSQH